MYETATYQKTDQPVYDTIITKGSEGAVIETQDVPSYGENR